MPPTPPPSAEVETGDAPLDLPDNALAIVLSNVPTNNRLAWTYGFQGITVKEACRLACTNKQFKDVLYSMTELWSPDCVILPLRMSAVEADSLLKRGGGKLKTVDLVMFRRPVGVIDPSPLAAIPWRLSQRAEWDVALQSLAANKALESITVVADPGSGSFTSLKACVTASLDALSAIAGDLPLSLKKISLSSITNGLDNKGLLARHVRSFEAAPCCRDGKTKLDVEACPLRENCTHVQSIRHCAYCPAKLSCDACLELWGPLGVNTRCETCLTWSCPGQACQMAMNSMQCEVCDDAMCDQCSPGETGECQGCKKAVCDACSEKCDGCSDVYCTAPKCLGKGCDPSGCLLIECKSGGWLHDIHGMYRLCAECCSNAF